MKQHQFAYVWYQCSGAFTANMQDNIALSIFPLPKELKGTMLLGFSKYVKKTDFFLLAGKRKFWQNYEHLTRLLYDFCKVWDDDTEALVVKGQHGFLKRKVMTMIKDEESLTREIYRNLDLLERGKGPFHRPSEWSSRRMERWRRRAFYSLMCTGMPNYRGKNFNDIVKELGNEGIS